MEIGNVDKTGFLCGEYFMRIYMHMYSGVMTSVDVTRLTFMHWRKHTRASQ